MTVLTRRLRVTAREHRTDMGPRPTERLRAAMVPRHTVCHRAGAMGSRSRLRPTGSHRPMGSHRPLRRRKPTTRRRG
jgi:hypothetical protein